MSPPLEEVRYSTTNGQPSLGNLGIGALLFALYLCTASMELAIRRHMTDGSLQWLRDAPRARAAIDLYCLPASYLARVGRSEEHTSELQSLRHLVCRLLLEKK